MKKEDIEIENPALAMLQKRTSQPKATATKAVSNAPTVTAKEPVLTITPHVKSKERYSKRLNLLIRPSTYKAITEIANEMGYSVNGLINEMLEQYISSRQ